MIDNKIVITGSVNWAPSATHANDETLLVINSPQLAKQITREMDRLWDSAELGRRGAERAGERGEWLERWLSG